MKIERKPRRDEKADAFYIEPRGERSLSRHTGQRIVRRATPLLITAVVVFAATIGFVKYTAPEHFGLAFALKATSGKVALTQNQLRDLVVGEGLVVYWLGPEVGARYALVSVNKNQNYVRYLPGGEGLSDVGANFRVIGTYMTKDAFQITQNDGNILTNGSAGFTNADGNAVYYNTVTHPLSAYVGMRNTDYQIEIFDPIAGQAVVSARTLGLIRRIA